MMSFQKLLKLAIKFEKKADKSYSSGELIIINGSGDKITLGIYPFVIVKKIMDIGGRMITKLPGIQIKYLEEDNSVVWMGGEVK